MERRWTTSLRIAGREVLSINRTESVGGRVPERIRIEPQEGAGDFIGAEFGFPKDLLPAICSLTTVVLTNAATMMPRGSVEPQASDLQDFAGPSYEEALNQIQTSEKPISPGKLLRFANYVFSNSGVATGPREKEAIKRALEIALGVMIEEKVRKK